MSACYVSPLCAGRAFGRASCAFVRFEDELAFRKWFAAALLPRALYSDSCSRCLKIVSSCTDDADMMADVVLASVAVAAGRDRYAFSAWS